MSTAEELMRRVMRAINEDDHEQLANDLTEGVVHHTPAGDFAGREQCLALYRTLREQDGWQITPHVVAATDQWGSAIHRNDFNSASYEVTTSGRIEGGKIAELWTLGQPPLS